MLRSIGAGMCVYLVRADLCSAADEHERQILISTRASSYGGGAGGMTGLVSTVSGFELLWGSGTPQNREISTALRGTSKITPRDQKIDWMITLRVWVLISGQYICPHHICTYRGDKYRTSRYPIHTEIVPRSRFSGGKHRGVVSLYQCNPHVSRPRGQPPKARTYTSTIFRDFKI